VLVRSRLAKYCRDAEELPTDNVDKRSGGAARESSVGEGSSSTPSPMFIALHGGGFRLHLRRMYLSSVTAPYRGSTSMRDVAHTVGTMCDQSGVPKGYVFSLAISANTLTDADLPFVLDTVTQLPQCKEVDLSNNRIGMAGGSDTSSLLRLLDVPHAIFVNITLNPLVAITNFRFFHALSRDHFKKLIFLTDEWLRMDVWQELVPESHHHLVEETHGNYFKYQHVSLSETIRITCRDQHVK
jgi:hypothetical protein